VGCILQVKLQLFDFKLSREQMHGYNTALIYAVGKKPANTFKFNFTYHAVKAILWLQ
jgi:hypothetical protein